MLKKSDDIFSALLAYRATPLAEGFSPGELMFGRRMKTPLGHPTSIEVNYKEFENVCLQKRKDAFHKWNQKHHAKYLPELLPGQIVWVKAPTDAGQEGIVLYKDESHPQSYWVKAGLSTVRRNRKHLFLLQKSSHPISEPADSIMPLALEWYFESTGDDKCDSVPIVNPGVSFDPNTVVVEAPVSGESNLSANASGDDLADPNIDLHGINDEFNASTNTSGDDLADPSLNLQVELNTDNDASTNTAVDNLAGHSMESPLNPISEASNAEADLSISMGNPVMTEELQPTKPTVTRSGRQPKPTMKDDYVYFAD